VSIAIFIKELAMNDKTQVTERDTSAVAQRTGERSSKTPAVVPAVDVVEDKHGITLWADLPGVTREKLDLRVEGPNLFIEAEATVPMPAELRVHHTEMQQPHFARAFTLSADFDTAQIDASLKDGVLKLTIPRREEARPRRIDVSVD